MAAASTQVVENPKTVAPETEDPGWARVMSLPCHLTVDLSVPRFCVADFLALHPGSIVGTNWGVARDVPLHINGILVGWAEMEAAGDHLAVRLTELA